MTVSLVIGGSGSEIYGRKAYSLDSMVLPLIDRMFEDSPYRNDSRYSRTRSESYMSLCRAFSQAVLYTSATLCCYYSTSKGGGANGDILTARLLYSPMYWLVS